MVSFWPLAGLIVYLAIAMLFTALSFREIARTREGNPVLALAAALFWPASIVAILVAVERERRRTGDGSAPPDLPDDEARR